MGALKDIRSGAFVSGIVPGQAVEIVTIDWIGDRAVNIVYPLSDGAVAETTLYRNDEHCLTIETRGRPGSFDPDGPLRRLVTEANRIKLAHYFDPHLAIHTNLVDPLPHQIVADDGKMVLTSGLSLFPVVQIH